MSLILIKRLLRGLPLNQDMCDQIFSYLHFQSRTARIMKQINYTYNPELRWMTPTGLCAPNSLCRRDLQYYSDNPKYCENCRLFGQFNSIKEYITDMNNHICQDNYWVFVYERMYSRTDDSRIQFDSWYDRYLSEYHTTLHTNS